MLGLGLANLYVKFEVRLIVGRFFNMRIALGGIHIESSIFTPYRSGRSDFVVRTGEELLRYYPWISNPDWDARNFSSQGISWVPLYHARALPGGVVKRDFFDQWEKEFFSRLRIEDEEEPIDILLLDIHGAMTVENLEDPEGYIAEKVRKLLGDEAIITASMDLHGNVSDLLFDSCDLITAYRTAPHEDTDETRYRAIENALALLDDKAKGKSWYKAKVDVPILLSGEKTSTRVDPGASLYASIDTEVRHPGVSDVAILMGFPWADEDRNHGVVVAYGSDKDEVAKAASRSGQQYLAAGYDFEFVGPVDTVDGAIRTAFESITGPFFISDTGDNPGAGGTNDSTAVLKPLLQASADSEKRVLFASLYDPEASLKLRSLGPSEKFSGSIGAHLDEFSSPLEVHGRVMNIAEDPRGGTTAVLQIGSCDVIITRNRNQYGTIEQFDLLGVDVCDYDIVAVKMGYLEPDLAERANDWVMALSTGAVNQDLTSLKFRNLRRPMLPFEDIDTSAPLPVKISTLK